MAEATIKTGIEIRADVQGSERIDDLSDLIRATSGETSELSKQVAQLQQQWKQAQNNQSLIAHYRSLKSSLSDTRTETAKTEQQMRQLAAQMQNGATKKQADEYKALQNRLIQLNIQKQQLIKTLRTTSQSMNAAGISVKNLAQQQQQLSQQSQDAKQQLQALNQIASAKQKLGFDVDTKIRNEIAEIQQAFKTLKASGKLSHEEMARAAKLQNDKLYALNKQLSDLRPTLKDVAEDLQGVATKATGLTFAAKEAMKFETAMTQVKKVTDGTPEAIAKLSGSLKEMAGTLGMMPDELAQIAAAGGQMGMSLEKLPEFTQMTAQMANAFGITAEQAGEMSAKISNVYGLTINEMRELGDAINTLGNTTAAKEAEIGNVLMRIGGNAKQFGLLKEEAAALSAAFVSLGKSPEEAGTAINALLTKLQTSTEQSNDFKNELIEIGLSAEEMAANIATNPQAALTDFLQRIEQLDKQSRSITLSKMFGAEYSDDLALLSGSLKTYEEALTNATDRTQTFGAMQKEAQSALENTEGSLKIAKANLVAAAIELGNHLLPVIFKRSQWVLVVWRRP